MYFTTNSIIIFVKYKVKENDRKFQFQSFIHNNLEKILCILVTQEHILNINLITLAKSHIFVCLLEKLKSQFIILNNKISSLEGEVEKPVVDLFSKNKRAHEKYSI